VSLLGRALERRAVTTWGPYQPANGHTVPSNVDYGYGPTGQVVNDQTAIGLSAVYACVRLLADSVASLPWDAYTKRDGQRIEIDPQPSLLRDPHPDLTDYDWKHIAIVSLALRGNFYGLVTGRDFREYPTEILPLDPSQIRVSRDPDTNEVRYDSGTRRLPRRDVIHVRLFPQAGQDVGLSPIMAARASIGLGLAAQDFGSRWFGDGASPSSVLKTEQPLNPDQAKEVKAAWIASHGGRRFPAVLPFGVQWAPISITPEESQFLETRRFQVSEIARIFGVPPHMLGDVERSTSWGTGIEQQSIGFVTYTLRPWLIRLESALNRQLPRGQFVKFNTDALLRGDTESRYKAYQLGLDAGFLNADEVRQLEDRPPIPGGAGQSFRQPLNMGPLGQEATNDDDVPTDAGSDES
jgi:HK97 family phage portal protein